MDAEVLMIWFQDPKIKTEVWNVYAVILVMIKTLCSLLLMELRFFF